MKIAMIAMSGIRAENPELMDLGLKLPGFLERARTLFAMPSLSLLTLAGMAPREMEIEYREYREFPAETPPECDLAVVTSFTAQIEDAYRIADIYRARGTKVVMGGLHASKLPEESAMHADAVAIGEGEILWPRILADFRSLRLQSRYEQKPGETYDFSNSPLPRYDLLEPEHYIHISFLNPAWEPSDVRHHLYSCGYERDEDALEVETQWVRNKTSPFSSLLMPR